MAWVARVERESCLTPWRSPPGWTQSTKLSYTATFPAWQSAAWKVGLPALRSLVTAWPSLLGLVLQAAQHGGKEPDGLGTSSAAAARLCPWMGPQVLASSSLGHHPQLPTFSGSCSQCLGCPQDALLPSYRKRGEIRFLHWVLLFWKCLKKDVAYLSFCALPCFMRDLKKSVCLLFLWASP